MKEYTFKKGIHPPHNKVTENSPLVECPTPETVYIPLSQHIGKHAIPTVAAGDKVKAGTLIGCADTDFSANVFSSVSGTVKSVEKAKTPTGACLHVAIENDGKYEREYLPDMGEITASNVLARLKAAGIVGMGGAGFPSHIKYAPKSHVDRFILNAAECEPYITCDHRLLVEHAEKVIIGAGMLAKALGLDCIDIGLEDNKLADVDTIMSAADKNGIKVNIVLLKSKYPQGAEKQMIYAVTGRKVPLGKLPVDVGTIVGNVHTAYALYEAAVENTPLFRRAVTVTGDVEKPSNLWVATGVKYQALADACGGAKTDHIKTVSGGPMMGIAVSGLDYSVAKTTGALLFLSGKEATVAEPGPCINCGKCSSVCPMRLMPMYIDAYTLRGDYATAKKYGAPNCIECGCCAYVCPAKRTLVQSIKLCKLKCKELGI